MPQASLSAQKKVKENIAKGCLGGAVTLLVSAGVVIGILWGRVNPLLLVFVGLTLSGLLTFGLMVLMSGFRKIAVRRAMTPVRHFPTTTARICFEGIIRPIGSALKAPFTGRDCVAYDYEVYKFASTSSQSAGSLTGNHKHSMRQNFYTGLYLTPSTIAGRAGSAKLLTLPILDTMQGVQASAEDGQRHLANTAFQSKSNKELGLREHFEELVSLVARENAEVAEDWCYKEPRDPDGLIFAERIIPSGAPVVIMGTYDPAQRGFVADVDEGTQIYVGGMKIGKPTVLAIIGTFLLGLLISSACVAAAIGLTRLPDVVS